MKLIFTCKTKYQFFVFRYAVECSEFQADEAVYETQSLYFNCRDQEDADSLERELQKLADANEVSGYFEREES